MGETALLPPQLNLAQKMVGWGDAVDAGDSSNLAILRELSERPCILEIPGRIPPFEQH